MVRPQAWHVAAAGVAAHAAYALWAFWDYRASGAGDALSLAAGTVALVVLLGAGALGVVPTVLLARRHRHAHWAALALGALFVASVLVALLGLALVGAGLWQWRQVRAARPPPGPPPGADGPA